MQFTTTFREAVETFGLPYEARLLCREYNPKGLEIHRTPDCPNQITRGSWIFTLKGLDENEEPQVTINLKID